jgi:pimeloyl-ACP methyl ester carboxylesterase
MKVWKDAKKMRETNQLLELGKTVQCPVVAIHGDFDPHPLEGVEKPLKRILRDFRFVLLKNCGHTPWLEKQAQEEFYRELEKAVQ